MESNSMIEREIKTIISESSLRKYKDILDKLATPDKTIQINYYFDTSDFRLNSLGSTLRIRQKENQLMLQYKYEKHYTGIEKICKEFEMKIQVFPTNISSKILPHNVSEPELIYSYIGNLATERINYLYNEVTISLDKNYYLGKCDHEIEIEFENYEKAEEMLEYLSIDNFESVETGKYNRFIRELQKVRKNNIY